MQQTSNTNKVMYMIKREVLMVPSDQQMKGEQQLRYHMVYDWQSVQNLNYSKGIFFTYLFINLYCLLCLYFLQKHQDINTTLVMILQLLLQIKSYSEIPNLLLSIWNSFINIAIIAQQLIIPIIIPSKSAKMDIFDFYPDDYKPQRYLTDEEMENITNELKNHPLFMKQLPKNPHQNQLLVALQHIKDEQNRNLDAQNCCKQGSQTLKKNPNNKHYLKLAYDKYTQGINCQPTESQILAKLHCNRALINLKNKNYGKVIIDCKICLKYDPNYTKAYYRCAQAFIAVKRFKEVLDLLKERKEPELEELIAQAKAELQKQAKIQEQKKAKTEEKLNQVAEYCQSKKYRIIKRHQPLPGNAKIQFIDGKLSIPILFAYPEFSQMDMVDQTNENQKIRTYAGQLFEVPLPWDQKKQYTNESYELFCQLAENKVMRIPKQAKIQEIAKRVSMKEALEIVVLAKDNTFYKIYLNGKEII